MARSIKVNDTDDKEQARGAFIDALIKSRSALEAHPELGAPQHTQDVTEVFQEALSFTGFDKTRGDKFWIAHVKGSNKSKNNEPYSKVKLQFKASFTPADADKLEQHLKTTLSKSIRLDQVTHSTGHPRVNVHIYVQ